MFWYVGMVLCFLLQGGQNNIKNFLIGNFNFYTISKLRTWEELLFKMRVKLFLFWFNIPLRQENGWKHRFLNGQQKKIYLNGHPVFVFMYICLSACIMYLLYNFGFFIAPRLWGFLKHPKRQKIHELDIKRMFFHLKSLF